MRYFFLNYTFSYQKTSELVKGAGERTISVFGGLGESFRNKLGEVKNSNTFKSFEERVGTTVYSVKVRTFILCAYMSTGDY